MAYAICVIMGAVVGGMHVNLSWKWGLMKAATLKQPVVIDGDNYKISKEE